MSKQLSRKDDQISHLTKLHKGK